MNAKQQFLPVRLCKKHSWCCPCTAVAVDEYVKRIHNVILRSFLIGHADGEACEGTTVDVYSAAIADNSRDTAQENMP